MKWPPSVDEIVTKKQVHAKYPSGTILQYTNIWRIVDRTGTRQALCDLLPDWELTEVKHYDKPGRVQWKSTKYCAEIHNTSSYSGYEADICIQGNGGWLRHREAIQQGVLVIAMTIREAVEAANSQTGQTTITPCHQTPDTSQPCHQNRGVRPEVRGHRCR